MFFLERAAEAEILFCSFLVHKNSPNHGSEENSRVEGKIIPFRNSHSLVHTFQLAFVLQL